MRSQYPRWGDCLELRCRGDHKNVFLRDYGRERFGLRAEPRQPAAHFTAVAEGTPTHG